MSHQYRIYGWSRIYDIAFLCLASGVLFFYWNLASGVLEHQNIMELQNIMVQFGSDLLWICCRYLWIQSDLLAS